MLIQLFNVNNHNIDTSEFSNLLHDDVVEEFEKTFLNDNNMYQDEAIQFYSEAMQFLNQGDAFSSSTIYEDKTGTKHTIDVTGRFRSEDDFNTIVKNKLKAIKKEYDSEFT